MKIRIFSVFLLISMLIHIFSTAVIVIGYELNKDYITKTYCENKNKPKLHCNGKCHVIKELVKEEKNEKSSSLPFKEKIEVLSYYQTIKTYIFKNDSKNYCFNSYYLIKKLSKVILPIFSPPS